MKKIIILTIIFSSLNSLLFAQLTKSQMWAISLTGIMTEVNSSNRNALHASTMDERGRNTWLNTLRRDWSVTTREELLETLDRMERNGHAYSFIEIKDIVYEIKEARSEQELNSILFRYRWDQTKLRRLNYVLANWDTYYNRTLIAWDLGRNISLCRWGYNVGFISEDEAWERIFHYARIIQSIYGSWEEYGYDYFMGRVYWASGSGEEQKYFSVTKPIYDKLMNSYWSWMDWYVDLNQSAADTLPVNTIRFLAPNDGNGSAQFWTNDPTRVNVAYYQYLKNPNLNENVFELNVKKISGSDGYGFGMLFCIDDTDSSNVSFYRFFITINGRFVIQKRTGSNVWAAAPVSWKNSSSIITKYGVYNKLRVERTDMGESASFRVLINGVQVAAFNDDNPINGKKIGMAVSIDTIAIEQFPHIPVDVRFDYAD